jgi:transposase
MSDDRDQEETSTHTSGRMTTRIEVAARVSGRRYWTVEQKLAILRDAFGPEGSVRDACERHDVGSGQVYTWRRQALTGELTGRAPSMAPSFAEVEVAAAPALLPSPAPSSDQIGIELPSGIRLTVGSGIDADALGRIVAALYR